MEFNENGPVMPFGLMQHKLAELKDILLSRFSSIESALRDAEESVTREIQQAEQTKESLKADIGRLETQLKEKEDLLSAREASLRELEERLSQKIRELDNQVHELGSVVREKDQLLEKRDSELKEMRVFLTRIREKESALSQAEALAERIKESLKVDVTRLEAQLKESDGNFHGCAPETEENSTTKLHELEDRVRREGILDRSPAE